MQGQQTNEKKDCDIHSFKNPLSPVADKSRDKRLCFNNLSTIQEDSDVCGM